MENGHSKSPEIIVPDAIKDAFVLTCHRFYAPITVPEVDRIDPRKVNITPRMGNFPCLREKCTLWNSEKSECWDVSAKRGLALMGDHAFAQLNDVHIQSGGA